MWNVEGILKVIELENSETQDQENIVDENIGEVELKNLIGERQIQMEILEITIEVSAEELLANEPTFENKIERRALLEKLCEIENEMKELSNRFKLLIGDDAEYRNEVLIQTQYLLNIKKIKIKLFCSENLQPRKKIISKILVVWVFRQGLSYRNSC